MTYVHMSSLAGTTHEDPVDHVALGRGRQEVRPVIVVPQGPRLLAVAGAPAHVPRRPRQISARLVHREHLVQGPQSGLVREEEAVVYLFTHFAVPVELSEEFIVKLLEKTKSIS
jgi:hypothetical protein